MYSSTPYITKINEPNPLITNMNHKGYCFDEGSDESISEDETVDVFSLVDGLLLL